MTSLPSANWSYPTAVRFGAGRIKELPTVVKAAGMTRPLLVTDPVLARMPMVADAVAALNAVGLPTAVFSDVKPNPVDSNIEAGVAAYKAGGHDGVIAFGGGSGLDAGKVIAFMSGQTRPMWDFEDIGDWWTRADPAGIAPIVAVPTTAGTGSEVGRAGVVTNEATHTKKIIFHPKMLPAYVICDPELTAGMPRTITVGTGMDALAHCLEAYSSPFYHPMSEGIAVEGVRLVLENLPKVAADGSDLLARGHMMSAAAMGAVSFQKGLGAIHSLSHPVGALYDTHHGMTNAVFMPYVLTFNRPAIEAKIDRLAGFVGISGGFDGFLNHILALREDLGVPHTLGGLGVDAARRELIAEMAVVDPTAGGNPVELTKDAALDIFDRALAGTV
ncbi:iron-containing alcohol dehydrogenase [Polymorphum gilvum]|uniref:Dehydrogenase, (Iron-containing alcohol dehydrogenase, 4-hydroxybutyrate dehydrogenase, methanol dehydrogenase) n=1 Tax=Polymorphum gilvum (strain LMG 25793 / CGMCC 1.9160 / SL003B-26A1) TaxID=991905 RepID=F2J1S3_POLGS|nr:iron-containing alcohol dehydrogenase [Polymorphum gilvum]ADZ71984.1 Dehydrogenase, (Iron-containing alcohol dehydrogenase, 4-hydroxybutyrate dehydrogenase, methanol dehydrogenase) [Polymorphum gilvum SL003B-26A1]